MRIFLLLLVILLAGCSQAAKPPEAPALTKGSGKIMAGKGVDDVALGMSRAEVEKSLGAPAETDVNEFNQSQSYALYKDKGLELAYDKDKLAMIVCHADSPWTPYTGQTAEGLWIGSRAEDVKKALGPPKEDPGQALDYSGLGIWFTFDKAGQVETIKVLQPK